MKVNELKKIEQKITMLEKGAEKITGKVDYKKGLLLLDIKKRKLYITDKCNSFEAYCGLPHKFKMSVRGAKYATDLSEFKCRFYLKKLQDYEKIMQVFTLELSRLLDINVEQFKAIEPLKTGHQIAIFEQLFESDEKITADIVADTVKNFTGTYEEVSFTDVEIEMARVFLLNYSPQSFLSSLKRNAIEAAAIIADGGLSEAEDYAPGWHKIGRHHLFFGDTSTPEFVNALPKCRLAFADPPYNAGVADWDNNFAWRHDYLQSAAEIVVVTPGIASIKDFMAATNMTYKWSVAAHITNGMTRGALGFGNWIYCAIFSEKSVHINSQDHFSCAITGQNIDHKGQKPSQFMSWILSKFTQTGDYVVDPFGGTGTTLAICENLGLTCYTGEIDKASFQLMAGRIAIETS
jgi:16S rRNA G966 N2-methylase RsmD